MKTISNYTTFWREIVVPNNRDYLAKPDDLRFAFHLSISLFHMADWVFWGNKSYINSNFVFLHKKKGQIKASNESQFANAIRDLYIDFELIRGIANSAKHLHLTQATKDHHTHYPSNAANTASQSTGSGTHYITLAGPNGHDLKFQDLAKSVYEMWIILANKHNWQL